MNKDLKEKIKLYIETCTPSKYKNIPDIATDKILELLYSHLLKKLPKERKPLFSERNKVGNWQRGKLVREVSNHLLSEIKQILRRELKGK